MTTLALGLLLGGALGNLVDRLHVRVRRGLRGHGHRGWRFYTYNVADAAISTAIVLLILMAVFPRLGDWAPDD